MCIKVKGGIQHQDVKTLTMWTGTGQERLVTIKLYKLVLKLDFGPRGSKAGLNLKKGFCDPCIYFSSYSGENQL